MGIEILLIVASGRSSRFGGFPKLFCKIGSAMNAENTIHHALKVYDKVYIGVNEKVYKEFHEKIQDCNMFSIVSGHGDAHSTLKCLTYIKNNEENVKRISVCWGDAVFVDETPFVQLLEAGSDMKIAAACAMEKKPYAWFDVNNKNEIIKAHFAGEEGQIRYGLHDQSLFLFDIEDAISLLNKYRIHLGIPYNNKIHIDKKEMRLLNFFEYLAQISDERARCIEIDAGKVLSFNTQEELDVIQMILKRDEGMADHV